MNVSGKDQVSPSGALGEESAVGVFAPSPRLPTAREPTGDPSEFDRTATDPDRTPVKRFRETTELSAPLPDYY
jgi:hypothetical protein